MAKNGQNKLIHYMFDCYYLKIKTITSIKIIHQHYLKSITCTYLHHSVNGLFGS